MSKLGNIKIYKLRNPIREYSWGSKTFISNLLGKDENSHDPQAEMWMGSHPLAPSRIKLNRKEISLSAVISDDPVTMLGKKIAEKYNNELPFLFKVLAAASPLSIQAHPNKTQAEKGFMLENNKNIKLDSPQRTYKDKNHKPEIICALTPFELMCEFQPINKIIERLEYLKLEDLKLFISELKIDSSIKNLKKIFTTIMNKNDSNKIKQISNLIGKFKDLRPRDEQEVLIFKWIAKLAAIYPKDMGVYSPLFLNIVKLKPAEAIFINAGVLHSYLSGCGVEVMANSDNVLRGGLTSKKIDIPELLRILNFDYNGLKWISPAINNYEQIYKTPAVEFQLSKITIKDKQIYENSKILSAEIILFTEGSGVIKWSDSSLEVKQGDSVFIPFAITNYEIVGNLEFFRVIVP